VGSRMFDVKLLELLVLVGALTAATSVSAQSRVSATGEAAMALGHGGGGEYRERGIGGFQFAASVRFRRSAAVSVFGEITRESLGFIAGGDAICVVSPHGGCVPRYPSFGGVAATAGLLFRDGADGEWRAGVGMGAFSTDDRGHTRVGALLGQLDGAEFPFEHVGITLGVRSVLLPRFRGDRLWIVPVSLGLRVR
jgi:hypothetical protein